MSLRALLLPGLDGSGKLFEAFEGELPSEWLVEVVRYPSDRALDYRGLEAELRATHFPADAPPTLIIAESFSGPLAIRLAADPPASLRAVVLVATFARRPVPRWLARLAARLPAQPPRLAVRLLMTGMAGDRATIELVRAAMAELGPGVAAARLRELGEVDVSEALEHAKVPIAILRAGQDRLVPASALPSVTKHEHVIAGPHLLLQTRASACAAAIREFVAELGLDRADH